MNEYTFSWFDGLFDADEPSTIPSRESTTIEDVERFHETEEQILAEPQTFSEAYRKKFLTELPF